MKKVKRFREFLNAVQDDETSDNIVLIESASGRVNVGYICKIGKRFLTLEHYLMSDPVTGSQQATVQLDAIENITVLEHGVSCE